MARYAYTPFPCAPPPDLTSGRVARHPVIIIGAGPVGLSAAVDLALHGVPSVVLDDNNAVSLGSRAICWSKRTLEIMDRLGVGARMVEKGVTWKVGRIFHGAREVCSFDLQPLPGNKMPAFINLQQYYAEQYLVERCADFPGLIDLRWKNKLTGLAQRGGYAALEVATPGGAYTIEADYVIACDGARSAARALLGLDFEGRVFEERFLIADVEMEADFPSERLFWFEPEFHSGQSALLHKQPDNIYRIDLQLGWDADPEEEKKPENVIPRIKAVVGGRPFTLEWVSVYTFQCRRLRRFVHDRVIFAGDSAHVVSPFGARGGNGGIQDADNLCWKLAAVIRGEAPAALLESYDEERAHAADENILNSARSTNFMTPKSEIEKIFRAAVLDLSRDMPFARRIVNSGRLSLPACYEGASLQTREAAPPAGGLKPGASCEDAPVTDAAGHGGFLLDHLGGEFILLSVGAEPLAVPGLRGLAIGRDLMDAEGTVAAHYGAGLHYLVRPDQHIAARFSHPAPGEILAAKARALGAAA